MSLLDRIFRRGKSRSKTHTKVREQPGPLTAQEAFDLAWPAAQALDGKVLFLLIQSGTDIRADGRSMTWEMMFRLPSKRSLLVSTLGPFEAANDPERAPIILEIELSSDDGSSPREGLPVSFRDSPEVVRDLLGQGVDFVAGPSDLKLESCVRGAGRVVWLMRHWDDEFETHFAPKQR